MTPTRALVVEDDPSWQQILTELLTDAGLIADVAGSYEAAAALLRAAPHRLAVVDLSLSGRDHRNEDGLRVLEALRRSDPACTPILLSGFATVELAVSVLREFGAHTCLRKERFRRAEFRRVLEEILALPPVTASAFAPPAATTLPVSREANEAAGGEAQVLVVEDDAGWRSLLGELLIDAGHQARLSSSYGEALGWLRRRRFDLAVVDLSLATSLAPTGNVDGYRLLAAGRDAGIPAIVVSGAAGAAEAQRALDEFGAFAFLEKRSFDRRAFTEAVAEALAARSAEPVALDALTEREREVLNLLVLGLTNKEIAERLVISPNTVKRHLKAVFAKLGVSTRAAAVAKAMEA
jgi:RNA polymerase sigma factor (sigma-70 family)